MPTIYVSFSPHIAKVLRKDWGKNGQPIDIPSHARSDNYWKKQYPNMHLRRIRQQPSLRELFIDALRTGQAERYYLPYTLAYSEEEYRQFPDSDEKKNELVAFRMPNVITCGNTAKPTNTKTVMEQKAGERFHQAAIFYFYDTFASFLHIYQFECIENGQPFNISEGIRLFSDKYDLSSNEQHNLRIQFYRRKTK